MSRANVARRNRDEGRRIAAEKHVLFIDGEAIVIDKPAGLAVHPGPRTPESLEDYLTRSASASRPPRPVHRLDRDTSGCLLLARHPKAHRRFQQAFERGRWRRPISLSSTGVPEAEEGTSTLPLRKVSTRRGRLADGPDPQGRPAVTPLAPLAQRTAAPSILLLAGDGAHPPASRPRRRRHRRADRRRSGLRQRVAARCCSTLRRSGSSATASRRSRRRAPLPPPSSPPGSTMPCLEPFAHSRRGAGGEVPRLLRPRRPERQQGRDRRPAALRRLQARPRSLRLCAPEGAGRQPDDRRRRDRHHRPHATAPRT